MPALAQLMEARPTLVQISKVGAGYVYRKGTDYRCADCWKFIAQIQRCAEQDRQGRVLQQPGAGMNCPTCGLPCDVVPPEALAVQRSSMIETPVVLRPQPTKCSRCDYGPQDIETGVFLNR